MEKNYSYFKLLNAFQKSGCPICHLVTETSRQYLDTLFYESVLDVPIRRKLIKSFGFCNWHTWQVPSLPVLCSPDAGFAIFASDLLRKFTSLTDELKKRARRKRALRSLLTKIKFALSPRIKEAPCPACVYVKEFESYYLKDLLDFLSERELLEACESSEGICLPHFMILAERWPSHANLSLLLHLETNKAQSLRNTLEEFIRKLDHRFQHELTSEERGAWKVAMEFLGGKQGVFTNELRHDVLKARTQR